MPVVGPKSLDEAAERRFRRIHREIVSEVRKYLEGHALVRVLLEKFLNEYLLGEVTKDASAAVHERRGYVSFEASISQIAKRAYEKLPVEVRADLPMQKLQLALETLLTGSGHSVTMGTLSYRKPVAVQPGMGTPTSASPRRQRASVLGRIKRMAPPQKALPGPPSPSEGSPAEVVEEVDPEAIEARKEEEQIVDAVEPPPETSTRARALVPGRTYSGGASGGASRRVISVEGDTVRYIVVTSTVRGAVGRDGTCLVKTFLDWME